jgi:hypothetical protein
MGGATAGWLVTHSSGSADGKLNYWDAANGVLRPSNSAHADGNWHHLAVTVASNNGSFYLDGAADGTFTRGNPGTAGGQTKSIAAQFDGQAPFNGTLAEMAVWSTALSAAEVASLANGFSPLLIRPSALVAVWPLLGPFNPELDLWKNNLAGTLVNGPAAAAHPRAVYPAPLQIEFYPVLLPANVQRSLSLFARNDTVLSQPACVDTQLALAGSV